MGQSPIKGPPFPTVVKSRTGVVVGVDNDCDLRTFHVVTPPSTVKDGLEVSILLLVPR